MLYRILCVAVAALACTNGVNLEHQFGSAEFSSSAWKNGGKESRGKMVASLVNSKLKVGATEDQFISLLGSSDCDGYEGALCYLFTSGKNIYQVEFPVDRSIAGGRVVGVAEIHQAGEGVSSLTIRSVPVPANTR